MQNRIVLKKNKEIKNYWVEAGEIFIVKELFRGFEWNRIAKGNRTKLGSMMYAYALGEGAEALEPLDKTPQNQQRYRKL